MEWKPFLVQRYSIPWDLFFERSSFIRPDSTYQAWGLCFKKWSTSLVWLHNHIDFIEPRCICVYLTSSQKCKAHDIKQYAGQYTMFFSIHFVLLCAAALMEAEHSTPYNWIFYTILPLICCSDGPHYVRIHYMLTLPQIWVKSSRRWSLTCSF